MRYKVYYNEAISDINLELGKEEKGGGGWRREVRNTRMKRVEEMSQPPSNIMNSYASQQRC